MASGFPGRDLRGGFGFGFGYGPAVQVMFQQRSDGSAAIGAGGLLKRPVSEMERLQQTQQALFLRSVKQKTQFASPSVSNPLTQADLSSASNISTCTAFLPSLSSALALPNSSNRSFPFESSAAEAETEKKSAMASRLLELERQLLEDDDDEASISGSAVTNCEWSEEIQKLISLPSTAAATNQHSMSSSPTTSSSSSSGSSFSITQSPPSPSRQMLLDTATAISEGDQDTAATNLAVLKRAANPRGDPDQRLTAIMVKALVSRLNPPDPVIALPVADVYSLEHHSALHMLYETSPCFKLGLMAANFAILEATKDHTNIHILDLDVGQGGQLASFINAVAERQRLRSPISIKITAVSDLSFPFSPHTTANEKHLTAVGDRLATLANRLGVGFRFNIVNRKINELDSETLGCEAGEALAVNLAFLISRVADESVSPANPRDELLRQVKSLGPTVVTLAEQEMNGNTAPFAARFAEACAHYGALLESLDATSSRESPGRVRIEACLAGKAANSIVHEGPDRVERCEVYGKWRARMGMAGFQPLPLGPNVVEPLKIRLASLRNNPGFTLKEEDGRLGCGWRGRVITVASAWR